MAPTLLARLNLPFSIQVWYSGTEDAVGLGALDIIIDSDALTDESLVYGTILTDVDTGLGLTFDKGIKLGDSGIFGDLTYTTTNGKVTITDCDNGATGELVIPDTIEGNPVISIGDNAFGDCENLTSITIPESVTSIGIRAFWSCTSLTSITIPESVTSRSKIMPLHFAVSLQTSRFLRALLYLEEGHLSGVVA